MLSDLVRSTLNSEKVFINNENQYFRGDLTDFKVLRTKSESTVHGSKQSLVFQLMQRCLRLHSNIAYFLDAWIPEALYAAEIV